MDVVAQGKRLFGRLGLYGLYGARLRFCLRMTVAGVAAFAVSQMLAIPLHGLWAVLTALVVTQVSVGGSLRSTADYVTGTLAGAIYASVVGFLPHPTVVSLAIVLALSVAPLAYAAALSPMFRVAPFTAATVLMISSELGEGPIDSALYRLFEVALGGAVAVAVSLFLLPDRAHGLGLDAAGRALERMARAVPRLLAHFTGKTDAADVSRLHDEIGRLVAAFQAIAAEAKRERLINLAVNPDPAPLSRTLLRLRHDLIIVGRASGLPLPDAVARRLGPSLQRIGESASSFLSSCASALTSRGSPPRPDPVEAAMKAYNGEVAALRDEGLTDGLTGNEVERLFALGFGLEQLHQHFLDLARCIEESSRRS